MMEKMKVNEYKSTYNTSKTHRYHNEHNKSITLTYATEKLVPSVSSQELLRVSVIDDEGE